MTSFDEILEAWDLNARRVLQIQDEYKWKRNELCEHIVILIELVRKKNKIHDMDQAIIGGMRRIIAVTRMVNNSKPDVRVTLALKNYDQCPLEPVEELI